MRKFLLLPLAGALLGTVPTLAQVGCPKPNPAACSTVTVTGRITDSTGEGMPGVSVSVKGAATGTATNTEGQYSLTSVPASGAKLQFKYLGFMAQEVPVGSQRVLDATMIVDPQQLDEVVVTALGVPRGKRAGCWGGGATIRMEEPPAALQPASRELHRQTRRAAAKAHRAKYLSFINQLLTPFLGNQASRK